ncbi:elongation factor G [Lutibaculum baratangense]|uniref:Elongation factor G n=1 Tax=Lutibaculum baratangense AMV1 TaxID=631454 RepID=V4RNT4_9HYPH|nr:elongation factor G [Lutibaculum baratangense]ESR26899.1 Translation elongation factor G-related protein [Lutibaculum baratangense AMV1]
MPGPQEGGAGGRCIAIVGPYLSGKTSLLEAILERCGAIPRAGRVGDRNMVGDASQEAREHGMSVEANVATVEFLGDRYTFIDCPGSVEFLNEARAVLPAVDAAIVVAEADEKKAPALQLILKELEDLGVPRLVFLNKIDKADAALREVLEWLQPASAAPLVLRQLPIWEKGIVTGFVDLALQRAFVYREHAPSEVIEFSDETSELTSEARFTMLERLADYDDELMEQLLGDVEPPRDQVFDGLATDFREGLIVPLFLGAAERANGVLRLLKALRHEAPGIRETRARLGSAETGGAAAQVVKTFHTSHGGKLSVVRVLEGEIADGAIVRTEDGRDERVSGVFDLQGQEPRKRGPAMAGETVGLGRLESVRTGDTLGVGCVPLQLLSLAPPQPVLWRSLSVADRKDEVKLTAALAKLVDEDPSLVLNHDQASGELQLGGQGEMHVRVALERLARKFGLTVEVQLPRPGYRETIRKAVKHRARHKKQTGGHGQFADVVVEIAPLARGAGFTFGERITGGAVPKQYIPSVEAGIRDHLSCGPLGFPVVDLSATLLDGSYHPVDSSDMAFRAAGRLAAAEALAEAAPVLLEPVMAVEVVVPSDCTSRVTAMVAQRRGQILGFDARPGWPGWDVVRARIPEAEMRDLIVELRSASAGVGSYTACFDHLAELSGKLAEQVIETRRAQAAA